MEVRQHPGDLVAIDPVDCVSMLEKAPWVRIGFVAGDEVTILPINHLLHAGAIYFRTAPGSKLGTAAASGPVTIEADDGDPRTREAWSVVAHGHASIVTDQGLLEELMALPFEPWALPDTQAFWVRVDVERVTGRRIVRPAAGRQPEG
jgi:nitroimidazol reductase NimA-like FMN-containing flavoprotein (pyridoxamine 5'-phosphate oxidase superfamily)